MIYIEPDYTAGYHTFQVFDEPGNDGAYDPTIRASMTRAELVAAIEQIDLHSNIVMADEINEDP